MAEVQWWYARDDEQLGPLSPGDLRRLAASGGLAPTDLVWREGMGEWAPAARIKGLFPESREPTDESLGGQPAPTLPQTPPGALPASGEPNEPGPAQSPEAYYPADTSRGEMFAGELPPVASARPTAIESGLFRTVGPSDDATSFRTEEDPVRIRRPSRIPLVLFLARGVLWGTCGLVVLLGGVLFSVSRLRAKPPIEEAQFATVLGMFFLGAYVVAQAGEKISQIVLSYLERRRDE
ncbi:MAG TPA: DUF4339 domain-containing protein [Pirellulales bacterium]|jgi:hypothetical protein|nr:DUF4339 domain-containing protein [Pirellulales bacterium]